MPETLNQKDIDALLQGEAAAAAAPLTDVVPYNFAHPPRVSKDRRAGLESIYGRFVLSLQALLSSRMRAPVDIVISSLEQTTFSEFTLALDSPCAAFIFKTGDRMDGLGVLDFGTAVAYHLVDRLLGGPGESENLDRPLTSLEQIVVRSVGDRALALLREAWEDELKFAPEMISFEANPDTLAAVNREDNVLVVHLEIHSGYFSGSSMIALPMTTLEPYLQDKAAALTTPGRVSRNDHGGSRPLVEASLQHAHVQVAARFPRIRLSARTVAELRPGQILHLAQSLEETVEVHVNGRLRYLGTLGQTRRRMALRITQTVAAPSSERLALGREGRVS